MTKSRDTADILEDVKVDGNVTAVGQETLKDNTGIHNTGVGYRAMFNPSMSGSSNVAFGNYNLYANTSGASNTALGYQSLFSNTTASNNTAVGYQAGYSNTTGNYGVAVGKDALKSNTTAGGNTAVGNQAMQNTTTAGGSIAMGYTAMLNNTTGGSLTGLGYEALLANTTGSSNTAVGRAALRSNTTASQNVAVGYLAGYSNQTGTYNTYVGSYAGENSTGTSNTFIGDGSGWQITGSKNTILGTYNGNQGGLDLRTSSNNIVLADGDGNPRMWINSQGYIHSTPTYNNTTGASANLHIESSGQFVRSTSSLRYKNTVNDATHGLTELKTLRPVTYKGNNDGDTVYGGLIAEEVHDAGLTEFVQYDDDNQPDALAYGNMVSLCIKAIQELSAKNDALEARIATLEG